MVTKSGPMTLEFNCRFGDPETQVLMTLLESDLYTIMKVSNKSDIDSENYIVHFSDVCLEGLYLAMDRRELIITDFSTLFM